MTIVGALTYPLAEKVLLLYAGIRSFRAVQSKDPSDDKQWLTFWLLYALFDLATMIFSVVGGLIPFYDEAKVGFIVFLGVFNGASVIYPVLEPILLSASKVAEKYEPMIQAKYAEAEKEIKKKIG